MSITPESAPLRPGYIRDAAGLYWKIGGTTSTGSTGGVTDHAALTGLNNVNAHPQYLLPTEIEGGANVSVDTISKPGSVIISALGGGGAGGGTNLGAKFVNVQDYTKGAADSTDGIRAAWQAGGIGATFFYPSQPNGYYVSASLKPFERTNHIGQMNPRYWWGDMNSMPGNNSLSVIRAAAGFTGPAVIYNNNTSTNGSSNSTSSGVYFHNLGIWGNAQDGAVDAFDLGPVSGAERSWLISQCMIAWSKVGVSGYNWVVRVKDCMIARNGWGIAPHRGADGNSRSNDSLYKDNYIFFNAHHAIEIGGPVESGLVGIAGNRLERSGTKTTGSFDPNINSDPYACGILITRATGCRVVDNSTDSNSGPGLDAAAVAQGAINNLQVVGNTFKRDGSGNGSDTMLPAVRFKQVDLFSAYGNTVTYGDPNDSGPGRSNPQYGVEFDTCNNFEWRGVVQLSTGGLTKSNGYKYTGTNFQYMVSDPRQPMAAMPASSDANIMTNPKTGHTYFSTTQHTNRTYDEASSTWINSGNSSGGVVTGTSDITLLTKGEYAAIPTKDPDQLYAVTTPGTGLRESFVGTTKIAEYTTTWVGKMNSFEGITPGTAVTTGNSGGVSGDAFNAVSGDVKAQSIADLTVPYTRGAVATLATTSVSTTNYSHADFSAGGNWRIYVRRTVVPPANQRVMRAVNGVGTGLFETRWQTDGTVLLVDYNSGQWIASMVGATAFNTIYRIEGTVISGNGIIAVYPGDSIIPCGTMVDEIGSVTSALAWNSTWFGLIHAGNQTDTLQYAAVGVSSTDRFGPAV